MSDTQAYFSEINFGDGIPRKPRADITIEQTVTQGSTNAVSGGAVYSYIDTMITSALNAGY